MSQRVFGHDDIIARNLLYQEFHVFKIIIVLVSGLWIYNSCIEYKLIKGSIL